MLALVGLPVLGLLVGLPFRDGTERFAGSGPSLVVMYLMTWSFLTVLGGGQEEPGWRGFALPRMQERMGPLAASVLLGVLWGLWHLPVFILIPGYNSTSGGVVSIAVSVLVFTAVGAVGQSLLLTWLFNNTRGSVLLVVLAHGSLNAGSGFVAPSTASSMARLDVVRCRRPDRDGGDTRDPVLSTGGHSRRRERRAGATPNEGVRSGLFISRLRWENSRMTRRSTTLTAIVVVVLLAWAGVSQTFWRPFSPSSTTSPGAVTAIEVRRGVDGLTVTTGERTEVRQFVSSWIPGRSGDVIVNGTTLTLGGCGWWCRVRYEVSVPAGVQLTGRLDSGDLTAENVGNVTFTTGSGSIRLASVDGPISVETGSGDIHIIGATDAVQASAGSGNITVTDPGGTVTAQTGSGNIDLTLAAPSTATLHTGSGNITARVPAGPYRIAGKTGSGNRDITVATDPASTYVLTLDTGSGNVRVQPR